MEIKKRTEYIIFLENWKYKNSLGYEMSQDINLYITEGNDGFWSVWVGSDNYSVRFGLSGSKVSETPLETAIDCALFELAEYNEFKEYILENE